MTTMQLEDCYALVGKPVHAPEIVNLLNLLGCTKTPKCSRTEPDAHFTHKKHGVELIFKDEDYLKIFDDGSRYGVAPLILIAISLGLLASYKEYPNSFIQLPSDFSFKKGREMVLQIFGQSDKF